MINADETRMPNAYEERVLQAAETVPPGGGGGAALHLLPGESIGESYIIHAALNEQGKQADVYLAKRWGKPYVIKLYHAGWRPSARMQSFLKDCRHPNIAGIVGFGEHAGNYFEIYEYYPEGTLAHVPPLTSAHLQNVVVPSINEGLRELHSNGIIHCDIKPDNLFYAQDGSKVVIGDCGISGYTNVNGKLVDAVRGTPEYAPRVKSLLWSAAISPAYDYGSFGLVLCRLILGRSLFEGMSLEEISRAWENGLDLPSQICGHVGALVQSLVTDDEDARWGYTQVKRWCENEYRRPVSRNSYTRSKREDAVKPLIFGRFDGETLSVSSLHQLANAIREHWEQTTRVVKRRDLLEFVRQFDRSLPEKIRELSLYHDGNAAVFKLLFLLEGDSSGLCYCGKSYASLQEYIQSLSSGRDPIAKQFLASGLLVYYLRETHRDRSQVDKLEQQIKRYGVEDMTSIYTICYALEGAKGIDVFGQTVDSMDGLVGALVGHTTEEIAQLIETDQFRAWLCRLGFDGEVKRMNELEGT